MFPNTWIARFKLQIGEEAPTRARRVGVTDVHILRTLEPFEFTLVRYVSRASRDRVLNGPEAIAARNPKGYYW